MMLDVLRGKPEMEDIERALNLKSDSQQRLFELAQESKDDIVYLRASIELSNHCRQNCSYCGNSRENLGLNRFRIAGELLGEMVDNALTISEADYIHFSFAEDINYPFEELRKQIQKVYAHGRQATLVLGDLPLPILQTLYSAAGGKPIRYTLKMETGDSKLFSEIRKGGTLEERLSALKRASEAGFHVGSGIIIGLPKQTDASIAKDILFLANYPNLVNISASTFSPSPGSLFQHAPPGNVDKTLNALAILRILCKDRHITIPASSSLGPERQKTALKYFANLVSVHLLPEKYQDKYLIYGGKDRNMGKIAAVRGMVASLGLRFNR